MVLQALAAGASVGQRRCYERYRGCSMDSGGAPNGGPVRSQSCDGIFSGDGGWSDDVFFGDRSDGVFSGDGGQRDGD